MNTPIPSRRAVASNRLRLRPVHRILTAGLSALLALSIQLTPTAHADSPAVTLTRIHSFGDPLTIASTPSPPVIEGSDGIFYGTTINGGIFLAGTGYRMNKDGSGFAVIKSFNPAKDGGSPQGMIEGNDGALYGTTYQAGTNGAGTVFRVNKDGSGFAVIKSFDPSTDGANPSATMTEGSDGALYGTTYQAGTNGAGTVFRVNKDGSRFTVLKSFDPSTDGANPSAIMIEASDGALYGTTYQAGPNGAGTVFRVNKDGSEFAVIKSFGDHYETDGGNLYASVTEGSDGALYGAAYAGGAYNGGTLFRLNKDGSGFGVLTNFYSELISVDNEGVPTYSLPDGGHPSGQVAEGSDGALYGTASQGGLKGGGTVFRVSKNGTGFAVLRSLDPATDGASPSGVYERDDGALYGTTYQAGPNGAGTVFQMNRDGSGFAILNSFKTDMADGANPCAGVIEGGDGALYGTANSGGTNGYGTVFRVNKDGSGFAVLKTFGDDVTGGLVNLYASVIEGNDGAIYGSVGSGGNSNAGTVFRVNKDGSGFTVLKSFDDCLKDGANPYAGVIEGNDGALYGTTANGGTNGYGTVFRMNKDGGGFAVLRSFDPGTDGWNMQYFPGLIEGSDGVLYGAANRGGAGDDGTVFRLNKDGSGFAVLRDFDNGWQGVAIGASVTEGSDGVLYGTCTFGGHSGSGGTVFRLNKDGSGFAIIHGFVPLSSDGVAGVYPIKGVTEGKDGALYGSTRGSVFRVNKDGSGFETLLVLDSPLVRGSSWEYLSDILSGSDGRLYGTSSQGGDCNLGTVFALQIGAPNQPVLLNPGNQTVNEGMTLAFTLAATDPNAGDTLAYSILSGAQPGMNLGAASGVFTWTPSEAQGPGAYAVVFRVTDSGGLAADQSVTITVNDVLIVLSSISPASATANDSGFTLTLNGNNFDPGTVVSWNATNRPTTYFSASQVTAQIPATDLQVTGDFVTALVTVTKSTGTSSGAVAFTIIGASVSNAVGQVQSSVASAGETVSVQTPPTAPDLAGVTAALENNTGSTPATVTAATYTENPTPAAAFEAGGGFVDLKVSGADPGDRLTSSFYYPQTVTGGDEDALLLKFFNGSQWLNVLSSGGAAPVKNTQDNLDGTVSGGRFQVVFDNTSTPQITELNGTVFAVAIPDTTPPTVSCPVDLVIVSDRAACGAGDHDDDNWVHHERNGRHRDEAEDHSRCGENHGPDDNDAHGYTCKFWNRCRATGVVLTQPVVTDNCGVASVINNHPSATYPLGATLVTWTATDVNGNVSTCVQKVTADARGQTIAWFISGWTEGWIKVINGLCSKAAGPIFRRNLPCHEPWRSARGHIFGRR